MHGIDVMVFGEADELVDGDIRGWGGEGKDVCGGEGVGSVIGSGKCIGNKA